MKKLYLFAVLIIAIWLAIFLPAMVFTTVVAAGGLVWIVVSLGKAWEEFKNAAKGNHPIKGAKAFIKSTFWKDALVSILFSAVGMMLAGVTGMLTGLFASIIFSIYIQIRDTFRKKSGTV